MLISGQSSVLEVFAYLYFYIRLWLWAVLKFILTLVIPLFSPAYHPFLLHLYPLTALYYSQSLLLYGSWSLKISIVFYSWFSVYGNAGKHRMTQKFLNSKSLLLPESPKRIYVLAWNLTNWFHIWSFPIFSLEDAHLWLLNIFGVDLFLSENVFWALMF